MISQRHKSSIELSAFLTVQHLINELVLNDPMLIIGTIEIAILELYL